VLRSELIRRAAEVTREILDRLDVAVYGSVSNYDARVLRASF
jgi:hypothetical protein